MCVYILVAHHRSIDSPLHPRMVQEWLGSPCPITTGCLKSTRHLAPMMGITHHIPWSNGRFMAWQDADEVTIKKAYRTLVSWGQGKVWVGSATVKEMSWRDTGMYSLFPPFLSELNHIIPLTGSSLDLQLCEDHLGFCPVIFHKSLCYFCKRCQRYHLELTVFQPRPLGSTVASRSKSSWSRNSRGQDIWDYPPSYLQLCFKGLNVHGLVKVISPNEIYSEERGPAKWCSPLDASQSIHTEEIWNPW